MNADPNRTEAALLLSAGAAGRLLSTAKVCLFAVCLLAAQGCGGASNSGSGTDGAASNGSGSGSAGDAAGGPPPTAGHSQDTSTASRVVDGHRYIGDIPYDVFFDNPTAVANDSTAVAVVTPGNGGAAPAGGGTDSSTADSASAGSSTPMQDWKELIPKQTLEDEASRLQNELKAAMINVGRYNNTYQQVSLDGTVMAAVAFIAMQHPEGPGWKENAKYVLNLGTMISDSASGRGRTAYDATLLPFEKISTIFAGSKPPDLEEPDPEIDLSLSVYRSGLMQRMQKAQDLMKKDFGREEDWTANRDKVVHEASVLAAMSALITSPDYDRAEEMEYRQYVRDLITACQEIISATKGENFDGYKSALDGVQKACDGCHNAGYRF